MKSRIWVVGFIALLVVAAITVTLIFNKKEINEANRVVDRTKVPVAVTTQKVVSGKLAIIAEFTAVLRPVEEANVYVQTPGIISSLSVKLGDKVTKGQVLGVIDSRLTELNLKMAELSKEKLADDYTRAKELFEGNATTEMNSINAAYNYHTTSIQVDQIKQQIANAKIISPISGIIAFKNLSAGEYAGPGVPLASVVNTNQLKATVFVDERNVYRLIYGQVAAIFSDVFPGREFAGTIWYISPKGDENHNYQVDLLLSNTGDLMIKAGTHVSVRFDFSPDAEALQIPSIALLQDRTEPYVFVVKGNRVESRAIVTGVRLNNSIEVVSGLSNGEEVVISGQINLTNGSLITIVNK
jgi:membrane fusion protein, multidrug efflux system